MIVRSLVTKKPASTCENECRIIHEWFAGWRWERYGDGALIDESPLSFETRDQCVADANRSRRRVGSVPAAAGSQANELALLAA